MAGWVHRLSNIDAEGRTGDCANCGRVPLKLKQNGWRCRLAEKKWGDNRTPEAARARSRRDSARRRELGRYSGAIAYRAHKGKVCEACGFVPQDKCQLDVDHIDGNHANNDPANLQTLCANCHRLKTHAPHLLDKTAPASVA